MTRVKAVVCLCVGLGMMASVVWATPTPPPHGSRFAQPGTLAIEAQLRDTEDRALAVAEHAVTDMLRMARTKAELDLAQRDNAAVTRIRPLVLKRRSLREREEALGGQAAGPGAIGSASSGGSSQAALMAATQQMQETQMSFNLQYLQLQNSMQNENRQFTMVSNIMKTKHDTARNSIGSIR